jgi:hypothetical protein
MPDNKIKNKCIVCKKTLRNYQPHEKPIHRICWLKLRQKDEKHLDFLFCKDRAKDKMKKSLIIEPESESSEDYFFSDSSSSI